MGRGIHSVSETHTYDLPTGVLGLNGPVEKPAPGTLPLRGDLAHIALAGTYLAAHYVVPQVREIGSKGADLLLAADTDSEAVAQLPAGTALEALDYSGAWCWGCLTPEGPSGYVPIADLAPLD